MQTPKFLRKLLQSNSYWDKNSDEFAKANEYLGTLFPGKMQMDATGRYVAPEYDMTYEQFKTAQKKIDDEFEIVKEETTEEVLEEFETYFDTIGFEFDIEDYVVPGEEIEVKVLYSRNMILPEYLHTYDLNIPEFEIPEKIWIWHSEDDDRICDDCASHDGEVFEYNDDIPEIPLHPNCRCWVEEQELDDNGKSISSKVYKGQKPEIAKDKILFEQTPKFGKPINTKPGQYAKFDGKTLTIYQGGKPVMSWEAVSGKPGYQSPEYQNLKNVGPIPEGIYVARQEKLQYMSPVDWAIGWSRVFGDNWGGKWPGSSVSWGASRVWLEPSKGTDTFGRDKFSIHGGLVPGSAGCIDMTGQINAFTSWLESTGNDLLVYVKYK